MVKFLESVWESMTRSTNIFPSIKVAQPLLRAVFKAAPVKPATKPKAKPKASATKAAATHAKSKAKAKAKQ